MKRNVVLYIVLVLLGLAGGSGSTMLVTKQKIDKSQAIIEQNKTVIAELQSRLEMKEKTEKMLQERSRSSDTKIMVLNVELAEVRKELEQARGTDTLAKAATADGNAEVGGAEAGSQIATVEYIVKDGDNFWNIAASQLGNGERHKEISKLNPEAAKGKYLTVGMKLRLPAK